LLVGVGFGAAEVVIQMENCEAEVPAGGQIEEDVEQADGIGAAGDGHADSCPWLEHAITGDEFNHALEHSPIVA
jgi:hypothetical protein